MRRLLADLGDPQHAWPAAHVAGTKGKGSTAAMLAAILKTAGYNPGLYTRRGQSWCGCPPTHRCSLPASSLGAPPGLLHALPYPLPCGHPPTYSPHIRSFHERIAVGGVPIPPADLDALVTRHAGAIEAAARREAGALSHFEIVTALAYKHFQEQQVGGAVGG